MYETYSEYEEDDFRENTELSKRVRSAYIRARQFLESKRTGRPQKYTPGPFWDGGKLRSGKRRRPIWPTLAKFIKSNRLNPEQLVHRYFAMCELKETPLPNHLNSALALEKYKTYSVNLEWTISSGLDAELAVLEGRVYDLTEYGVPEFEAVKSMLLDANFDLSPLVRYCMALKFKMDDIAEYSKQAALWQYMSDVELYQRYWKKILPDNIDKLAEETYLVAACA